MPTSLSPLQFVICTAIAASCVLFFRESSPPTPPSLSTALEHHCHDAASSSALISPSTHVSSWRQLVRGVKLVSQRRSFWSMTLSTGISLGAYFGLQAVLDELLAPIFVDGNGGDIGVGDDPRCIALDASLSLKVCHIHLARRYRIRRLCIRTCRHHLYHRMWMVP